MTIKRPDLTPGVTFSSRDGTARYTVVQEHASTRSHYVGPKWIPAVGANSFTSIDQPPIYIFRLEECGESV